MAGPDDPLTLSREDLYELVWSKPITELAKDFGLSDVALAKRCRRLRVPVPGRGYWARVAAGQAPRQPTLPKRTEEPLDYTALTFDAPEATPPPVEEAPRPNPLRQQVQDLQIAAGQDLRQASAPVKRTAVQLKRPWRREIEWNRGERKGPIIAIDVTESCADRALELSERIIASAALLGWAFKTPPKPDDSHTNRYRNEQAEQPVVGCFLVDSEALAFRIDERSRRADHELTDDEKARKRRGEYIYPPRWDYFPTGELRVYLMHANSSYAVRTWKDGARLKLEDQVKTILLAFVDEAASIKARREERRLAELERQRAEKLRWEQSERRSANETLIQQLETQVGAWLRARLFRAYIRALGNAIKKAGIRGLTAKRQDATIDFLRWAQQYVDQLDPLRTTPHEPDFEPERSGYFGSTDKEVNETLHRLLGNCWHEAFKISPPSLEGSVAATDSIEDYEPKEALVTSTKE
jgi:hypothetical protein